MTKFIDANGREWAIVMNINTARRINDDCGFDVLSLVEGPEKINQLTSNVFLLVDVIYSACRPQAKEKQVTDEQFGEAMSGDVISEATNALLMEIAGFFPQAKAEAMKKILKAGQAAQAQIEAEALANFAQMEATMVDDLADLLRKQYGMTSSDSPQF